MHEREVDLAPVARVHDRSDQFLDRDLSRLLGLTFPRVSLRFAGLAKLDVDGAQYPVDEPARGGTAEGLGKLDSLVDGDLRRHLRAVGKEELGQAQPQDVAVDGGYPLERPL